MKYIKGKFQQEHHHIKICGVINENYSRGNTCKYMGSVIAVSKENGKIERCYRCSYDVQTHGGGENEK